MNNLKYVITLLFVVAFHSAIAQFANIDHLKEEKQKEIYWHYQMGIMIEFNRLVKESELDKTHKKTIRYYHAFQSIAERIASANSLKKYKEVDYDQLLEVTRIGIINNWVAEDQKKHEKFHKLWVEIADIITKNTNNNAPKSNTPLLFLKNDN